MQLTCPYCNAFIVTRVESKISTMQILACSGIFICGCVLGCCLIPFCIDDWKDVEHFCPNCNAMVGKM